MTQVPLVLLPIASCAAHAALFVFGSGWVGLG